MVEKIKYNLDRLVEFLEKQDEPVALILTGALARDFYDLPRQTVDIDAEIHCSPAVYERLYGFCRKNGILVNIGENISGWGMIPLPEGYRERAKTVKETGNFVLKVLAPIDYVFSKLARGTEIDEEDALDVCVKFDIGVNEIEKHLELVKLPLDPETRFFLERLERFKKNLASLKVNRIDQHKAKTRQHSKKKRR
jgi:hypothetical protein